MRENMGNKRGFFNRLGKGANRAYGMMKEYQAKAPEREQKKIEMYARKTKMAEAAARYARARAQAENAYSEAYGVGSRSGDMGQGYMGKQPKKSKRQPNIFEDKEFLDFLR